MTAAAAPARAARVAVQVPRRARTSGPGFDTLGLALSRLRRARRSPRSPSPALEVEVARRRARTRCPPTSPTSSCARSRTPSTRYGRRMPGLDLEARNAIPHGRGLGSSGAAIVSGHHGGQGPARGRSSRSTPRRCCALATELEGHPDNVAPALFGGLTIAWVDDRGPAAQEAASCTAASRRWSSCPSPRCRPSVARSLQPAAGAARGRDLQRLALGAAHRRAHPEPRAAARRDRGQAAPELPRAGDARDRSRSSGCCATTGFAAVVSGAGPSDPRARRGPGAAPRGGRARRGSTRTPRGRPHARRRLQGCYSE